MKKLAIDSYYKDNICKTVGVIFNEWDDKEPDNIIVSIGKNNFSDYIPGQFYKRELPGILDLLEQVDLSEFDTIILDSYIDLLEEDKIVPGLGRHLIDELEKSDRLHSDLDIIGVAKSKFGKTGKISEAVIRGESKKPLFIQSYKRSNKEVGELVKGMYGDFRIPHLLKVLDQETKKSD